MRKHIVLSVILFCSCSLSANEKVVHFAIQEVPPYLYKKGDSFAGPIFKLIRQLERDLGIDGRYDYLPWPRIISAGKAGQERVLVRHSMVPDREPYLNEILLGYKIRKVNYIRLKDADDAKDFNALKKYRIGARNLAFYSYEFNESELDRYLVTADPQLFQMLIHKRIDFAVTYDVSESKQIAANSGLDFDENFSLASYQENFLNGRFISIPYGTELDLNWFHQINCAILDYRRSGKIDAWFQEDGVKPYIQNFEEPASITQEKACASYRDSIR